MVQEIDTKIKKFLKKFHIEYNSRKLKKIPNSVILASLIFSVSAMTQFFADVIIEVLSYFHIINKIPFRVDFVSLTVISALLGLQTVAGLRRKELDITKNAIVLGIVVELALIVGDLIYINAQSGNMYLQSIRYPFLLLTTVNILLVLFIYIRLKFKKVFL